MNAINLKEELLLFITQHICRKFTTSISLNIENASNQHVSQIGPYCNQVYEEIVMIAHAYTLVKPWTVVVKTVYAAVADIAVN